MKRICPRCFTRWYSADTAHEIWICEACGAEIPRNTESADVEGKDEEDKR